MSPTSNVRPFVPRKPSGPETGEWQPRLLAAIAYLALGYFGNLNLIMLLGLLYWGLVQQRKQMVPFFLRFHLIQAMVLFLMLAIFWQLILSTLGLLNSTVELVGLRQSLSPMMLVAIFGVKLAVNWANLGFGAFLAVLARMGKSLTLPVVTQQARSWA